MGARSALVAMGVFGLAASHAMAAQTAPPWAQIGACQTLSMGAVGGPAPTGDVAVLRYAGSSNYELTYRDTVLLFNAEYTKRVAPARSLGVEEPQLTKATAIYIGHGHSDHMASVSFVATQSKAKVYGAKLSTDAVLAMGVPQAQVIPVKNGDVQKYPGFTVEAVLARHASVFDETGKVNPMFQASTAAWEAMRKATQIDPQIGWNGQRQMPNGQTMAQGTSDRHVLDEGTMGYLVTFETGYKMYILDSSGNPTKEQQAMMARVGHLDVATVSYQGFFIAQRQIEQTMPLVELFKPDVFLPNHHDETGGFYPDMAGYPLFMAIRDKLPRTQSIAPMYRTPICFNTKTKDVFVGETWAWPAK